MADGALAKITHAAFAGERGMVAAAAASAGAADLARRDAASAQPGSAR